MGVGSILLGIASFLFMFGGFLSSVIPVVGTLLSFGAPLLAIAGIVTGGIGLSRAKRDGEPTGAPMAGLIVSIVALIPALLVAVTCGLCNACFTAGMMSPRQQNQQWWLDGGTGPFGPGLQPSPSSPLGPQPPGQPGQGQPPGQPGQGQPPGQPGQGQPGSPPPAFPPPPIDDPAAAPGAGGSAQPSGSEPQAAPEPTDPGSGQPGAAGSP